MRAIGRLADDRHDPVEHGLIAHERRRNLDHRIAAVIEAALSAWKEGKSCDDLRKLSPPIHVADERWHGGATITSYTIGEGKPFGPSTRFEVTLEGPPPIGTKKATYTVSTQPAISIALGD